MEADELAGVAAGEVGSAYGAGEESVAGEQQGLVREIEADAALGVAGGVKDGAGEAGLVLLGVGSDGDGFAVVEGVVRGGDVGSGDAEPGGLGVHHFDQREVVQVVEDGCAGELFEAVGPGDMVDVGVGDDDLLDGERVFCEEGEDAGDVVAGIDDDGLVGGFVAEDGAVALEQTDGENFEDHGSLRLIANDAGLTRNYTRDGFWIALGNRSMNRKMRKPMTCALGDFEASIF